MENYKITEYPTVTGTRALFSKVNGCIQYNKDVMLEINTQTEDNIDVLCIYLTNEQTEQLIEKLQKVLERNKEINQQVEI